MKPDATLVTGLQPVVDKCIDAGVALDDVMGTTNDDYVSTMWAPAVYALGGIWSAVCDRFGDILRQVLVNDGASALGWFFFK